MAGTGENATDLTIPSLVEHDLDTPFLAAGQVAGRCVADGAFELGVQDEIATQRAVGGAVEAHAALGVLVADVVDGLAGGVVQPQLFGAVVEGQGAAADQDLARGSRGALRDDQRGETGVLSGGEAEDGE